MNRVGGLAISVLAATGLHATPRDAGASSLPPPGDDIECPTATIEVGTADELQTALDDAVPGDVIHMADGTYVGTFVAAVTAEPDAPIFLCGSDAAVIDGDGIRGGYGFHLDGVSYWRVIGFTVRNAQKGLIVDRGQFNVIQRLTVTNVGDEAIHLRGFSSDNVVQSNSIRDTGLRRDKFGEGIYVGTAESNWCEHSDCEPDQSDRNVIEFNTISHTGAESIDLKEGTTGGVVRFNNLDGDGMTGGDSWVDAKGNDWLIADNHGVNSPMDGFQMHEIVEGWGTGNVFTGNTADVNGPGLGFAATNTDGNVIRCDNDVTNADGGFSDQDCVED